MGLSRARPTFEHLCCEITGRAEREKQIADDPDSKDEITEFEGAKRIDEVQHPPNRQKRNPG